MSFEEQILFKDKYLCIKYLHSKFRSVWEVTSKLSNVKVILLKFKILLTHRGSNHVTMFNMLFLCMSTRSAKSHHNFSLSSFVGVIQHAGHKRTSQGPLGSKLNTAQVSDLARPSSTQSVATQFGE